MSRATLDGVIERVLPVDPAVFEAAQEAFDRKTKPRGSLGELESLASRIAAIRGTASPGRLRAAVVLAAGDHGYARRGVSAYPAEVTGQMLANFAAGGAAVNVLARETGAAARRRRRRGRRARRARVRPAASARGRGRPMRPKGRR